MKCYKILFILLSLSMISACTTTRPEPSSAPSAEPFVTEETIYEDPYPDGLNNKQDLFTHLEGTWNSCYPVIPEDLLDRKLTFKDGTVTLTHVYADEYVTSTMDVRSMFEEWTDIPDLLYITPEETSSGFLPDGSALPEQVTAFQVLTSHVKGKDLLALREIGNGGSLYADEGLNYNAATSDMFWIFERDDEELLQPSDTQYADMRNAEKEFTAFLWSQDGNTCYLQEVTSQVVKEVLYGPEEYVVYYRYPAGGHALTAVPYEYAGSAVKISYAGDGPYLVKVRTGQDGRITSIVRLNYLIYGRYQPDMSLPAEISFVDPEDPNIADYLHADVSGEGVSSDILLYPLKNMKDFKFSSITLTGMDPWDHPQYSSEDLFLIDELPADTPLAVTLTFIGDLPGYGFSFTDTDGRERHFALWVSGENGSLSLGEY
ncbi:MAG: hypothetical protein IJJ44_01555 [Solobacterium sp.]|nr:hypothetical protein [Solobacterium sp.]